MIDVICSWVSSVRSSRSCAVKHRHDREADNASRASIVISLGPPWREERIISMDRRRLAAWLFVYCGRRRRPRDVH